MTPVWRRRVTLFLLLIPVIAGVVTMAILFARGLRELPQVQSFIADYPGSAMLPDGTPVGVPAWIGWQHFLNAFFLVLIVRSGWRVRTIRRPEGHWTRKNTWLRTKGKPRRVAIDLWFHLVVDALWVANGVLFIVLLFVTGQWARLVPTGWDVIPQAISATLQYVSFDWPTENGWVNYNALQLLTYFFTVFIAAPLAIITGIRMSPLWLGPLTKLDRIYPVQIARKLHLPIMIYFVIFVIVHVTLVLATGALRNLNHMYALRDDTTWWGAGIFTLSMIVTAAAVIFARPVFLRSLASLTGNVSR